MLAARPPHRRGSAGLTGVVVPAAVLGAGVALIRTGGAHVLAWAGAVGTPLLAAAGLWRLPLAAALWVVAWKANGLVAQGASVALVALAAITVARLAARVAPAWSIAVGLVVIAVVDVVLVWGTHQVQPASNALHAAALPSIPRLQDATFGSDGHAHTRAGGRGDRPRRRRVGPAPHGHTDRARDRSGPRGTSFGRCGSQSSPTCTRTSRR